MDGHNYTPESPESLRAPSQDVRPRMPEDFVSFDGGALIWIDAILLVPAIFGVMFLPGLLRLAVLSVAIALTVTYGLLYSWARVHPASASAHLLEALHIAPHRRVVR